MTDAITEPAPPEPGLDPDPRKQRLALLVAMAKTGIKPAQLAREIKVTHAELSKLINHEKPLSPRDANRLTAWLKVPAWELTADPAPPPPPPVPAPREDATAAA